MPNKPKDSFLLVIGFKPIMDFTLPWELLQINAIATFMILELLKTTIQES